MTSPKTEKSNLTVSKKQTCPYDEKRTCKYAKECNDAVQEYGMFEANNECVIALHWQDNHLTPEEQLHFKFPKRLTS